MNKSVVVLIVSVVIVLSYYAFYDYRLYVVEFDDYVFTFGERSDDKFREDTFFDSHISGEIPEDFYFKIKNKDIGGFLFTNSRNKFKHLAFSCKRNNCVENLNFRILVKNLFGNSIFELDSREVLKSDRPLVFVNKDLLFVKSIQGDNISFHFLDLKKCDSNYSVLKPYDFDSPIFD